MTHAPAPSHLQADAAAKAGMVFSTASVRHLFPGTENQPWQLEISQTITGSEMIRSVFSSREFLPNSDCWILEGTHTKETTNKHKKPSATIKEQHCEDEAAAPPEVAGGSSWKRLMGLKEWKNGQLKMVTLQ